ncbi:MAG: hypothetical protein IPJ13_19525 [Saprospiraceae bacterium]|nr:hypothetical protein [Saprospiraceae bacterium]
MTPSVLTTYTVTVSNASGCTHVANTTVTVNQLPVPTITGKTIICSGQSTTLTAAGGTGYLWSTGQTTAAITVTPSVLTTYTVTVSNASGCTHVANTTVTVNQLPVPTITGNTTICSGQTTTLTAAGGTSYLWSTGQNTASITIAPAATTTYTVTVTNASGCTHVANKAVTINQLPVATITGNTIICIGQSTTLTASGGTGYLWSTGQTTAVSTVAPSVLSTYTVTVTSTNGCTAKASTTVTQNGTSLIATASNDGPLSCSKSIVTLTATGGGAYSWSGGETTASKVITAPGTYTVTVTSNNGCTTTASSIVTTTGDLTTLSIPDITVCGTTPPPIVLPGPAPTIVTNKTVWDFETTTSAPGVSQNPAVAASGSFTAGGGLTGVAMQTASRECSKSISATGFTTTLQNAIEQNDYFEFCIGSSGPAHQLLEVKSIQWNHRRTNGFSFASWTLVNAQNPGQVLSSGSISEEPGKTITALPCTPVIVNLPPNHSTGCFRIYYWGINFPMERIDIDHVEITSSYFTNGTLYKFYSQNPVLNPGAVPIHIGNTFTPTTTVSTSPQKLWVVAQQNNTTCKSVPKEVTIAVHPSFTPSVSNDGPLSCTKSNVTITATGGGTYSWSGGGTTASKVVTTPGSYAVTVTNTSGCSGSATSIVNQTNTGMSATATNDGPLTCVKSSVTLTATGGGTYSWSGGGTSSTKVVTTPGTYTVTVTSSNGCTASTSTTVSQNITPPSVTATNDGPITCNKTSVTLTATGGGTYSWSGGGTNASKVVTTPGSYTVTVTNTAGCSTSATSIVTSDFAIPTVSVNNTGPLTCFNSSVSLWAFGGGTYLWENGLNFYHRIVTAPGTYTVTVTGENGCSATGTTTVLADPAFPRVTNDGPLSCSKRQVTLYAAGGTNYSWSGGGTGNTKIVTSPGTYYVTITGHSCPFLISQTINSPFFSTVTINGTILNPSISNDGPISCTKPSVTLTATGGGTYSWSGGGTNASKIVTTPGNYTVTVTNTAGCSASATSVVNQTDSGISATVTDDGPLTCVKSSVTLTATGNGTYLWSGGGTSSTKVVTIPGTYTVTVTSSNGCTAASSTTVTQNITTPTITATNDGPITCNKTSVTLTATGNGTYLWSGGGTSSTKVEQTRTTRHVYSDGDIIEWMYSSIIHYSDPKHHNTSCISIQQRPTHM